MTNAEAREQARKSAEQIERVQNLRAMERLMINLGGKVAYIKWLEAMPEDADMSSIGVISQDALRNVAANEEKYANVLREFATYMGPVLMGMIETEE